ncbi:MAG: family N-acetyltransferase [Ilumatobacteraceae bacterium]|nr:family N-acetyltransferase [Ilumatobacteraceae bacterium]
MPRIVTWSEADGPVVVHAARLRAEHAGETVDVQEGPFADALVGAGASIRRRSLLMALDPLPSVVDGGRFPGEVGPMVVDPARHAGALLRAFPPEHPDHDPAIADLATAVRAMTSYVEGSVIGPFVAEASSEAVDPAGRVVGGLVVNRMPEHDDSPGGPWVTEVFVEPDAQGAGAGRALFARTVAELRAAGDTSLRLAVQIDNPAQHLYRALGFATVSAWSRIEL